MPPKKRKPLVWCPTTFKALITTAGEFREYYLPLSEAEIEADLQHLASLIQQTTGKRGLRPAQVLQPAVGEASSEDYSPSSQQGEDENESGNPSEQQQWGSSKAAAAGGGAGASGAPAPPGQPTQQQQAVMA